MLPTREAAMELLRQYNKEESHISHALAVEAVMRHWAVIEGADDADIWAMAGLLHDIDYEMFPEQHCQQCQQILADAGYPDDFIRSIQSHGYGICSDIKPESRMEQVLYTVDELTGLVVTTALVRPSRSLHDLSAKSVKKKWKAKQFAAGVDRAVIENGAAMLGIELNEVISRTIDGMRAIAGQLGLQGEQ